MVDYLTVHFGLKHDIFGHKHDIFGIGWKCNVIVIASIF